MENKYYTPSLEEFHMGFEYEELFDEWIKYIVKEEDVIYNFSDEGVNLRQVFKAIPEGRIRVKHLDKEDILKEGWVHVGGFWYEWPVKDTIYCNEFSNRPLDFRLNFVSDDRYLMIDAFERNSQDWERVYSGPVKSINELRTIMRWFNIKK